MIPNIPVSPVVVMTNPRMTMISCAMASSFSGPSFRQRLFCEPVFPAFKGNISPVPIRLLLEAIGRSLRRCLLGRHLEGVRDLLLDAFPHGKIGRYFLCQKLV